MTSQLQPTLTGEHLELRPLRAEHFDDLFAIASDPMIWEQHPYNDRYKLEVFKEFFRVALESGGAFVVIDLKKGTVIGSSRYYGYDPELRSIEVGWTFLARSYWGGAVNRELKWLMLRHAFTFVENVLFYVGKNNIRSQRAMEKIGGVLAGTRTDPAGRESVIYRISSDQFAADERWQQYSEKQ